MELDTSGDERMQGARRDDDAAAADTRHRSMANSDGERSVCVKRRKWNAMPIAIAFA